MAPLPTIQFAALSTIPNEGALVIFADEAAEIAVQGLNAETSAQVSRAAKANEFTGKSGKSIEILAPAGTQLSRLIVVGIGKRAEAKKLNWLNLGGALYSKLPCADTKVAILTGACSGDEVALIAQGAYLRAYNFDNYKTKRKDGEKAPVAKTLSFVSAVDVAKAANDTFAPLKGQADGVLLARELVNLPPNVLGPVEFATRTKDLEKLGVKVEILSQAKLTEMGFGSLLAVGRGSEKDSQVVIMHWNGAADKAAQPICFVGKGVTFDTGGISIKPSNSMEDMKGDMGGAACVTGLMHALASRKAPVNVIGAIGLVENMPDGTAYRPGDILTSLSGQTIEVVNTDAEGRLVLADVLWHVGTTYKPKFIVDLATLTGAILVALGTEHAGLFGNNDELAQRITAAGLETGEKVWRLPLSADYDKLTDSKFADMKNSGGRNAGSITAAQFLQRFIPDNIPWVHLDVAGTAMDSPASDINTSWGSGWGVRLLDQVVANYYQ